MKLKKIVLAVILSASSLASLGVNATVIQAVNMTFQSGATFSGNVTFADDYTVITDVTGILSGYQYGTTGFLGSGSTAINWVWANGQNYSSGANNYAAFLMDGAGSGYTSYGGYSNWILFSYNYSGAPTLTFTSGVTYAGQDNFIDYRDPMVSGSIGAVPEPGTLALLGLGLAGLGLARRKKA